MSYTMCYMFNNYIAFDFIFLMTYIFTRMPRT